jgi:predicted lipid-binding transport protein (Tim44 family)
MNTAHAFAHRQSPAATRPRLQLVSAAPKPPAPPPSARLAALLGGLVSGFVMAAGAAILVGADASGELTTAGVLAGIMCVALVRARLTVRRTARRRQALSRARPGNASPLGSVAHLRRAA